MTVEELICELERLPMDAEVRLAEQPSWPFEYDLSGITEALPADDGNGEAVYLVEGSQLGYLPENVREELGW